MKKVEATGYIEPSQEPYLMKAISFFRESIEMNGFKCDDDQEIIDAMFDYFLRKECAKYGYKG